MKGPLIVGLVFLSASAPGQAQDPVYIADVSPKTRTDKMSPSELRSELDSVNEYARVSRLAALNDGAPDEMRFWLTWATFDPSTNGIATVGYVVTDNDWKVCRMADLRRLSAFADFSIDCEIQDGEWVTIDAVSSGKRFVVSAGNPASCDGDAAKLVARSLNRVRIPRQ